MTYEEAAKKFLDDGMTVKDISEAHPEIKGDKLSKLLKEKYKILDLKKYLYKFKCKKYEKAYQEYSTTEISIEEICSREHIGRSNLRRYIQERGNAGNIVYKSKYHCDNTVFDKIDTPEKAYWLGFLYADGYNSGSYIQVTISKYDINHLKKFRRFLYSDHPIRYREVDNTVNITISDKKLSNDLSKKGCVKGKTYCASFPCQKSLPRRFTRDFLRGFFDGDGYIKKMILQDVTSSNSITRKVVQVSFTIKMKHFAEQISDAIFHCCNNVKPNIYHADHEPYDQYQVYIEGESHIRDFLDTIYRDSFIYLDRKYAKYLKYILPSDLETDQIINAKLSENILPDLYDAESEVDRMIRTEGVPKELDYRNIIDRRKSSQGQSVGDDALKEGV